MQSAAHCPYHPLHELLGFGAEDFTLSRLLPRFPSITIFTAGFPMVPCCVLLSVDAGTLFFPHSLSPKQLTCQPLLCRGAQQEEWYLWRLSKAHHGLGVLWHGYEKQTAFGFVGGYFCCISVHVHSGIVYWRLLLLWRAERSLRKNKIWVQAKPIPTLVPYASSLKCCGTNEQKQPSHNSHYRPVLHLASGPPLHLLRPWAAHLPVHSLCFGALNSWCLGLCCLVYIFPLSGQNSLPWVQLAKYGFPCSLFL